MTCPNASAVTGVLGIIGFPIGHTLSPLMHNAALRALHLKYQYVPFEVAPEHLASAVQGIRALGIRGVSVTIPHKTAVLPLLDELHESAQAAGAVNTIVNDKGVLTGFNTDGDGLVKSLFADLAFEPTGKQILIAGAGGACRGAAAALCRAGASQIWILNRSVKSAENICSALADRYPTTHLTGFGYDTGNSYLPQADLLLNTTSLGMAGESLPGLDLDLLGASAVVYDMVYAPPITPLLRAAAHKGVPWANGLGMLAAQGELAFRYWTQADPPAGLMKQVLLEHTGSCKQSIQNS